MLTLNLEYEVEISYGLRQESGAVRQGLSLRSGWSVRYYVSQLQGVLMASDLFLVPVCCCSHGWECA